MTVELTEAAEFRAAQIAAEHEDNAPIALMWQIQTTSDTAMALRRFLIEKRGYDPEDFVIRTINFMILPGQVERLKNRHVEPCPLCGEAMKEDQLAGEIVWRHPLPAGSGALYDVREACLLHQIVLRIDQLDKWNERAKRKRHVHHTEPCRRCGSATPETYSEICGHSDCPNKGA